MLVVSCDRCCYSRRAIADLPKKDGLAHRLTLLEVLAGLERLRKLGLDLHKLGVLVVGVGVDGIVRERLHVYEGVSRITSINAYSPKQESQSSRRLQHP